MFRQAVEMATIREDVHDGSVNLNPGASVQQQRRDKNDLEEFEPNQNENYSGDEASCSSTTSMDSLFNQRARSQKARNMTEKRRRDKLNMYINQLAALLPPEGHQKMDKSSILEQGVNYLNLCSKSPHGSLDAGTMPKSSLLSAEELGELMLEVVSGFVMVINEKGIIKSILEVVKSVLGLEPMKVAGQSIESIVHPDDWYNVRNKIERMVKGGSEEINTSANSDNSKGLTAKKHRTSFVPFSFRLNQGGDKANMNYRDVCCGGYRRDKTSIGNQSEQTEQSLVLMVWPKDQTHLKELCYSKMPSSFSSRHGMDGKFLFVDTSCTRVTGYLPHELLNTSLYLCVHETDLEEVIKAHKSLTMVVDVGSILLFFRFRSKSDQWLLMKVILRVTYNPMTSKAEYFDANFSLATRDEISQYKKLKISHAEKQSHMAVTAENSLTGSASRLLASLARDRQLTENAMPKTHRNENSAAITTNTTQFSAPRCNREDQAGKVVSPGKQGILSTMPDTRQMNPVSKQRGDQVKDHAEEQETALNAQLAAKLDALSHSVQKQKDQLARIRNMMSAVQPKMLLSEGLKKQQQQEQQIYEYITTTIAEQEKQCNKLKVVLKSKMKVSETKRRTLELRGKAKMQKSLREGADKQRFLNHPSSSQATEKGPKIMFAKKQDEEPAPSSSGESSFLVMPRTSQDYSRMNDENREQEQRFQDYKNESSSTIINDSSDQDQHSLQRQLQQLQHQQDVLNAQGMALAAQGNIPNGQLEILQSLMQQQVAFFPQNRAEECAVPSSSTTPIGSGLDLNAASQQQSQLYQQILSLIQSQCLSSSGNSQLDGRQLDIASISSNNAQSQILLQLQNLQQQLQFQMQALSKRNPQNEGQQADNVSQVVMALQQLQQLQIRLLQSNSGVSNNPECGQDSQMRGNAGHHQPDQGYLRQCPSPADSSVYSPTERRNSFSNVDFGMDMQRHDRKRTGSNPQENDPSFYQMLSQRNRPVPQLIDTNEAGTTQLLNSRPRLPATDYGQYPRYPTPDGIDRFAQSSQQPHDRSVDHMGRYTMFGRQNPGQNGGQGSDNNTDKKDKLEDDDFYPSTDNLPGQTQQLLQLHQAQRMHIVRRQHQQLQALRNNQSVQQHQPPQQQQQHQPPQQQHQLQQQQQQHQLQQTQQQVLQQQSYVNGSQAQQEYAEQMSPMIGYGQHLSDQMENPSHSNVEGPPSTDLWPNDLQADQVGAMSDLDLFELLSGQNPIRFTEEDEQVLDLLIAESGDMQTM